MFPKDMQIKYISTAHNEAVMLIARYTHTYQPTPVYKTDRNQWVSANGLNPDETRLIFKLGLSKNIEPKTDSEKAYKLLRG